VKERDELINELRQWIPQDEAEELINDFAWAMARKVRMLEPACPDGFVLRPEFVDAWNEGKHDAADEIDPYEVPK
jgi:hypothetical protein